MSTNPSALDRLATRPPETSQATAVEQARAVAEVAAAVRVARDFPRDEQRAWHAMEQSCGSLALAERAFFSLPRAGGRIEGSTVHLARELARCWGNIDYGIRELRRDDEAGVSEMQAWAWDQESNVRSSRSFVVPHAIMAKGSRKHLTDLGDIANNNNSVAARAVRETINTVLPAAFKLEAERLAAATLQRGDGGSLADQAAEIIKAFHTNIGVSQSQIEDRLQRPVHQWTAQDLGVLRVVGGEIARGEKRAEDEFPSTAPASTGVTADEIKGGA